MQLFGVFLLCFTLFCISNGQQQIPLDILNQFGDEAPGNNINTPFGQIDYMALLAQLNQIAEVVKTYLNDVNSEIKNLSEPCVNKTIEFLNAVQRSEDWALSVVDSWGKPNSGIFNGGNKWVGEYSQCLGIGQKNKNTWNTKYCLIEKSDSVAGPAIIPLYYGICVSDKCNQDDIIRLINIGFSAIIPLVKDIQIAFLFPIGPIELKNLDCKEEKTFYASTIVVLVIISFILAIVLAATLFDTLKTYFEEQKLAAMSDEEKNQNEKKANKKRNTVLDIISSLSVVRNAPKVFHVSHNPENFGCLNGLRVISITFVVLGHTLLQMLFVANNAVVLGKLIRDFWYIPSMVGFFSVDTFFVMSGFLLSFGFLREVRKSGLSVGLMIKYYVHRYWRLTPLYGILLLFSAFVSRHMGNGPFFPKDGWEPNMCKDNWWTNFLYLNNLVRARQETNCFGDSWYLANDMQFHWIAPLVLIPFFLGNRKRFFAIALCIAFIFIHILSNALIMSSNKDKGWDNQLAALSPRTFDAIYITPWCRIGPFAIGVLLGFYLDEFKKKRGDSLKIDYRLNLVGWFLSIAFCALLVFGIYPDFSDGERLSSTARIMYEAFSRIIWSFGIAYVIFACVTTNGGIVNRFLSAEFWIPLARLSYGVYLIHMPLAFFFNFRVEHPIYLQHDTIIYSFFANWIASFGVAYFLNLFFDMPFSGLEKFMFRRK